MNLRHRGNMATLGYWLHLVLIATLPMHEGWQNFIPWLVAFYFAGSLTITVGFHRLFSHQSFETYTPVRWFFAIFGVLFMYGSPLQWKATHGKHHTESDGPLDPHQKPWTWRPLLTKSYRNVPLDPLAARPLLRQDHFLHTMVDRYYLGVYIAVVTLTALVDPRLVYMALLPGIGLVQIIGSLHNTCSHIGGRARDLWFLEYLLPAGGEWLHGLHHDKPGRWDFRTRWYHLDTGALVVRLIRSNSATPHWKK